MIAHVLEPEISSKEFRQNWARLIRKIHEVDPLCCPKCNGRFRVVAFIEDPRVIRQILEHLGLWLVNARAQPLCLSPPISQIQQPDSFSQLTPFEDDFCQLPPELGDGWVN